MRIPSGKIDIVLFFVAVDSTDLKTRKTGLSAFTVYRSRNGGAATVYTTPTITELSSSNMPGVYCLLIDEDTTIASTSDAEEQALHITCATMAPVTRVVELFRRDSTSGRTQLVDANGRVDVSAIAGTAQTARDIGTSVLLSSGTGTGQLSITAGIAAVNATQFGGSAGTFTGGRPEVNTTHAAGTAWNSGAITVNTFAAGAITAAKFAANALDAVWSTAARLLTAGTNIVLAKGVGITGFNDLDAPGIRAAVGLASANLDTQLATFATAANLTITNNNVLATYNRIGAPVSATISTDLQAIAASIAASPTSILDLADGVETGLTVRKALRGMTSALMGKASGLGTVSPVFRDFNDTKDRLSPTVDQWGNRSAITRDLD